LADKRMDEQEFVQAVGLNANDLEWIVQGAPPVSADVRERIRRQVHEQTAKVAEPTAEAVELVATPTAPRRRWNPGRIAAAAALVMALSATAVLGGSAQAREALLGLFHLVPGMGITQATDESLALAAPLTVESAGTEATILAAVAGPERTEVKLKITGLPGGRNRESDGTYSGNAPKFRPEFPAELVLPDGVRMAPYVIKYQYERGTLSATFSFDALPAGTSKIRLEVPTYRDVPLNVAADIPLTDAATVVASVVDLTGAATELQGIKVEALQYAVDQDLIRFRVGITPLGAIVLDHGNWDAANWVSLTDDAGRTYPLSTEDSDRLAVASPSHNAAFAGPLPSDATQLNLTVPKLFVREPGTATLELDVPELAIGDSMPIGQQVMVGDWPVDVQSLVRESTTKYTLKVGLGPAEGDQYLDHISVVKGKSWYSNGWMNEDRVLHLDVGYGPTDGKLSVVIGHPVLTVTGPWVVNVPLQ
jgi:hypothetical protein